MGLPPRGACWARWHCGRQFGESRCEADILLPCHLVPTRQLSWEAKRKRRQAALSACWSITSWVTASTLVGATGSHQPTCGYPELFLFSSVFFPSFCFCLELLPSLCSGEGCPTHTHTPTPTPTPFQHARGGVTLDWSLQPHAKRGDLLTFAFSQGAPYTMDLFVTNSGDLIRRRSVSPV